MSTPLVELEPGAILWRDDDLLLVHKPAGIPSDTTPDASRDHLGRAVSRLLERVDGVAPGPIWVHNRLDLDTSGVVAFATSVRANGPLGEAFARRTVTKRYLALVTPAPPRESFGVQNHLKRGPRGRMLAVRAGGDRAETEFEVLARTQWAAMVEARPLTGRTHQIRVHLAELGCPIVGDPLYGPGARAERLWLHAVALAVPHPLDGRVIAVSAEIPEGLVRIAADWGLG